jgi:5-methylthioribose kinase
VPGLVGELSVEPAGEGNINFVRRVRGMGGGSVVVKHARPTLERFPEYSVTQERLCFERRYAEVVEELAPEVALLLPRVIDFDEELPAIVMEDLGDAPHLERLLLDDAALAEPLFELGHFLGRVHTASAPCARELVPRFANDELRSLHGEHIFTLPFEPNEFPIPDAVRQEACSLLASGTALKRIRALRRSYYESAEVLVHGDVQGTNVLVQGGRPRLLDAEIAHVGDPAFDLGVARAHVEVHGVLRPGSAAPAEGGRALLDGYGAGYRDRRGTETIVERSAGFAAVEVLRRTLGAARLPFLLEEGAALTALRRAVTILQ